MTITIQDEADSLELERQRLEARVAELEGGLRRLADLHHRTLIASDRHAPENQEWTECPALTCEAVAELLGE